ncbi:hypothetical protein PG990_008826 [Apiospora arundinis]
MVDVVNPDLESELELPASPCTLSEDTAFSTVVYSLEEDAGVWALLEKDAGSFDKLVEKCLRGVEVRRLAPLAEYNVVIPADGESAPSFDVAVGEPEFLIMSSEVLDASPSLVLDGSVDNTRVEYVTEDMNFLSSLVDVVFVVLKAVPALVDVDGLVVTTDLVRVTMVAVVIQVPY